MSHKSRDHAQRGSTPFVLGVWAALTFLAVWFVYTYGNHTPRFEDWFFVPLITGFQPPTLEWVWKSEQGHRIPVLKAAFYLGYKIFGFDSKPFLFLNAGLLSISSLGLLWAARKSRGVFLYSDACIPILLLNFGHSETFCWALTLAYVMSTCLMCLLLGIIVVFEGRTFPRGTLIAAGCVAALPFVFGGGVVFSAPFLIWVAYQCSPPLREAGPGRISAFFSMLLVLATIVFMVYYVATYQSFTIAPSEVPIQPSLFNYFLTAWKFEAMGLGAAAARPVWPISGGVVALVLVACLASFINDLRDFRILYDPRISGLALFVAASLGVGVVFGFGRSAWGEQTIFNSRYVTTAVPTLLGAYFVFEYSSLKTLGRFAQITLLSVSCAFFSLNFQKGVDHGYSFRRPALAFEKDLAKGMSIPELVSRHSDITYYYHDRLENYLRQLRDAKFKGYESLPPDPTFIEEDVPLNEIAANEIEWNGREGTVKGLDGNLLIHLNGPRFVCGVRVRFACADPSNISPFFMIKWDRTDSKELGVYRQFDIPANDQDVDVKAYIYKTIKSIVIFPNNHKSRFRITRLTLLLPKSP